MKKTDLPFILTPCDQYPEFRVRFVKGQRIDDVEPLSLTDLGLPVDMPKTYEAEAFVNPLLHGFYQKTYDLIAGAEEKAYVTSLLETKSRNKAFEETLERNQKYGVNESELAEFLKYREVYYLESWQASEILDEFVFIIEKLIPRSVDDLFKFLGLDVRPLYYVFFDLAAEKLNLERYTDNGRTDCGQFKTHMQEGVERYLLSGASLLDIYNYTCATKTIIKSVLYDMNSREWSIDEASGFVSEKRMIECILFGIKDCQYKCDATFDEYGQFAGVQTAESFDFAVYDNGAPSLVIDLVERRYRYSWYPNEGKGHFDTPQSEKEKEDFCREKHIPYLKISYTEMWLSDHVYDVVRKAVKDPESIDDSRETHVLAEMIDRIEALPYKNHEESRFAKICGCCSCGEIFTPDEIKQWNDGCAICPVCGWDEVIFDSQGLTITEEIMQSLCLQENYISTRDIT